MSRLTLKNVTVAIGAATILHNICLDVEKGEIVCLLGESGCGKSTLLKTIAGLLAPESGEIYIEGQDAGSMPVEKRDTVIVFQDMRLFPHMDVLENVEFGLKMKRVSRSERRKKALDMLERVGLYGLEKRRVSEISGGQRQRVALARAIAANPRILLLDEPFSSLDASLRSAMRELVCDLHRQTGITTLLVTHDREDALTLAHKTAVMKEGRILQFGDTRDVYERPLCREVADYFGPVNYIDGRVKDGIFGCPAGAAETAMADGEYTAAVKPHNIRIEGCGEFEVVSIQYFGDRYNITAQNGKIRLLASGDRYFPPEAGRRVGVGIDFSKAVFFKERESNGT